MDVAVSLGNVVDDHATTTNLSGRSMSSYCGNGCEGFVGKMCPPHCLVQS